MSDLRLELSSLVKVPRIHVLRVRDGGNAGFLRRNTLVRYTITGMSHESNEHKTDIPVNENGLKCTLASTWLSYLEGWRGEGFACCRRHVVL